MSTLLQVKTRLVYGTIGILATGLAVVYIGINRPSLHINVNRGSCLSMLADVLLALQSYAESHQGVLPYSDVSDDNALIEAGVSQPIASQLRYINKPLRISEILPDTLILFCRPQTEGFDHKVYVATADGRVFLISEAEARLGGMMNETRGELLLRVFPK